jgi:hypothetical protein
MESYMAEALQEGEPLAAENAIVVGSSSHH